MRTGSVGGPHGSGNEGRRAAHFDPHSPTFEEGERSAGTKSRGEPQAIVRAVHAVASGQCDPREPTADLHGVPAGGHQRAKRSAKQKFHAALIILALLAATSCATLRSPSSSSELATLAQPGPYRVAEYDMQWFDPQRNRAVPVHIYAPIGAATSPVIIFSHGLGNSRMGYRYLGEHWASHGYLSVHPEHLGANTEVMRHGLWRHYRAGFDRRNWRTVPEDIQFVIDQLQDDAALPSELRGHVDRLRIGVSGHSLGAYAALAVGGLRVLFPDGSVINFRDPRVRAAIPISMSENFLPASYREISIPMLHITGTHDSSYFYGTLPRKRRRPFNSIPRSDQYQVVIRGANHSTFSDDEHPGNRAPHDVIRASTLLFWKAYLEDDQAALRQLREGGLERYLDGAARFSKK
jgi:predicted dienelactone hydrolase